MLVSALFLIRGQIDISYRISTLGIFINPSLKNLSSYPKLKLFANLIILIQLVETG